MREIERENEYVYVYLFWEEWTPDAFQDNFPQEFELTEEKIIWVYGLKHVALGKG